MIRGGGGIFDVTANDKRVFSKHDEGRFPTEREIIDKLKAM
jgi:selT/selW/selH-like putative selenoprotein